MELEGIVSKRRSSAYEAGRARTWLKTKCVQREEFVIVGWTDPAGTRQGFGSLILGVFDEDGELQYVGNVGTGFSDVEIRRLLEKLKPSRRETSPFSTLPKMPRVRKDQVVWVEPQLVAEVEFAEFTHDRHLGAQSYQGLREDKAPVDVHREER